MGHEDETTDVEAENTEHVRQLIVAKQESLQRLAAARARFVADENLATVLGAMAAEGSLSLTFSTKTKLWKISWAFGERTSGPYAQRISRRTAMAADDALSIGVRLLLEVVLTA